MSEIEHTIELLSRFQKIIVSTSKETGEDGAAACLGLVFGLRALGKEVSLVGEVEIPERLKFASQEELFQTLPQQSDKLVVELDTTKTELGQLSYETKPGKVSIFLQSKEGSFSPSDVSVSPYFSTESLMVFVGVTSPEKLGSLYGDNVGMFYRSSKLNIDIDLSNERFGNVNYLETTAGSLSEAVFMLLQHLENPECLKASATVLLAGLLANTDSLKNSRTMPGTFLVASGMVTAGADHSQVAASLFKTLGYPETKLLGKILTEMVVQEADGFAYAVLDRGMPSRGIEQYADTLQILPELASHVIGIGGFLLLETSPEVTKIYGLGTLPNKLQNLLVAKATLPLEERYLVGTRYSYLETTVSKLELLQTLSQYFHKEV